MPKYTLFYICFGEDLFISTMSEIDHYKNQSQNWELHTFSFIIIQIFIIYKNSDESSLEALFNMICAYKIGICNLNLEIDIDLYLLCLNLTAILTISWQMSATYKNWLDCVIYRPEGLSSIFICLIFYVLFSMCKYSFYCVLLDSQPSLR